MWDMRDVFLRSKVSKGFIIPCIESTVRTKDIILVVITHDLFQENAHVFTSQMTQLVNDTKYLCCNISCLSGIPDKVSCLWCINDTSTNWKETKLLCVLLCSQSYGVFEVFEMMHHVFTSKKTFILNEKTQRYLPWSLVWWSTRR